MANPIASRPVLSRRRLPLGVSGRRPLSILLGLALLAAPGRAAEDPAPPEHFQPMAFLVGSCWKGSFPDGQSTDEHCFEWIYGKFIRDRHVVKGPKPDYIGETIYAYDPQQKKVIYWYVTNAGFFTTGSLEYTQEGIVFPEKVVSGSETKELKTLFEPRLPDAYWVRSLERTSAGWKELWTMELKRQPRP
jgi:hypothetical protein